MTELADRGGNVAVPGADDALYDATGALFDGAAFNIAMGVETMLLLRANGAQDADIGASGEDAVYGDNGLITFDADGDPLFLRDLGEGQDTDDDKIHLADGDDLAFGQFGDDFIVGGEGRDFLVGDGGYADLDDTGERLVDRILIVSTNFVSTGNDTLSGREDPDALFGGLGSDLLLGHEDCDILYGDQAFATTRQSDTSVTLPSGNMAFSSLAPYAGAGDILIGGGDNDIMSGGAINAPGGDFFDNGWRSREDAIFGNVVSFNVSLATGDHLFCTGFSRFITVGFPPWDPFSRTSARDLIVDGPEDETRDGRPIDFGAEFIRANVRTLTEYLRIAEPGDLRAGPDRGFRLSGTDDSPNAVTSGKLLDPRFLDGAPIGSGGDQFDDLDERFFGPAGAIPGGEPGFDLHRHTVQPSKTQTIEPPESAPATPPNSTPTRGAEPPVSAAPVEDETISGAALAAGSAAALAADRLAGAGQKRRKLRFDPRTGRMSAEG